MPDPFPDRIRRARLITRPERPARLADGPHTGSVIAIDHLGNESPRRDYTWTVDTAKPAAPPVMTGPEPKTKDTKARFDISVFAGGRNAQAAMDAGGGAAYFAPRLTAVFPNYHAFRTEFENWPRRAGMGYSCPAPGDVTGTQKSYAALIDGRIAVAGEHTSPPWFGYMEGALQSG